LKDHGERFEDAVRTQVDQLVNALYQRRDELLDYVRQEKAAKVQQLKQTAAKSTAKLQKTTGLIQYSIEALKETDSAAFLQVLFF
jgi:tripartite motif-containing protein 9/67